MNEQVFERIIPDTVFTTTLLKFVYSFGYRKGTPGTISEDMIVIKTIETYQKLTKKEIKRISDETNAYLLYRDDKEVILETSLEDLIKICEVSVIKNIGGVSYL